MSDLSPAAFNLASAVLAKLAPLPAMPLSEWIEAEIRLPEGLTAKSGPMRLYPYQREIADAIGDPRVERITLQKSARIGFSALMVAALGYYVACDASPILLVLPVEGDCKDAMKSDIEPIFRSSPALNGLLREKIRGQRGLTKDTLLSRYFPGGSLKLVSAATQRALRRHTVRILSMDEFDAFKDGAEGSSIELAERRTMTFPNRKIIQGSTPIDEETSHICRAYEASDQRVFEVPCPECGGLP